MSSPAANPPNTFHHGGTEDTEESKRSKAEVEDSKPFVMLTKKMKKGNSVISVLPW
jgi:hypothetical protein